jgi:hypothetical protein
MTNNSFTSYLCYTTQSTLCLHTKQYYVARDLMSKVQKALTISGFGLENGYWHLTMKFNLFYGLPHWVHIFILELNVCLSDKQHTIWILSKQSSQCRDFWHFVFRLARKRSDKTHSNVYDTNIVGYNRFRSINRQKSMF